VQFQVQFPPIPAPPRLPRTPPDAPGVGALSDLPPDMAELARRLAALPEAVRAAIVAMVKAAKPPE